MYVGIIKQRRKKRLRSKDHKRSHYRTSLYMKTVIQTSATNIIHQWCNCSIVTCHLKSQLISLAPINFSIMAIPRLRRRQHSSGFACRSCFADNGQQSAIFFTQCLETGHTHVFLGKCAGMSQILPKIQNTSEIYNKESETARKSVNKRNGQSEM